MIETVLRCHATDRRQPIQKEDELPEGWVSIPLMTIGSGTGEPRVLEDIHFVNCEVMAEWANSQFAMRRSGLRSA
jgi:hypothetical protein